MCVCDVYVVLHTSYLHHRSRYISIYDRAVAQTSSDIMSILTLNHKGGVFVRRGQPPTTMSAFAAPGAHLQELILATAATTEQKISCVSYRKESGEIIRPSLFKFVSILTIISAKNTAYCSKESGRSDQKC